MAPGSVVLPLVVFCCALVPTLTDSTQSTTHQQDATRPAATIPITEHIKEMGYPVEAHEFVTEDGYILTYHRIPYGRLKYLNSTRPPVLVQHGLFCGGTVWAEVNDSLGFLLADAGYDVWLANSRGSEYSRKHIWYDPVKDKKLFWDWSFHELGYYDLPAAVDYILNVTRKDELSYVGHSLGTTMFFVFGSTRPEYMSKIKSAALMAPVAYIKDIPSPIFSFLAKYATSLEQILKVFGIYEVLPYTESFHKVINFFCSEGDITQPFCLEFIFSLTGHDPDQTSKKLLTTYLNYLPAGTSTKLLMHLSQIVNKDFRQYDYGLLGNLKHYHFFEPPSYHLDKVAAPVYLYSAPNDWIVTPNVVIKTAKGVSNLQKLTLVEDIDFNHVDFMWANDIKALVYDDVIHDLYKIHKK